MLLFVLLFVLPMARSTSADDGAFIDICTSSGMRRVPVEGAPHMATAARR